MKRKIPVISLSILVILMCSLWEYNVGYRKYMDTSVYMDAEKPGVTEVPEKKMAYITFDDGPSAITDQILDILAENDVHATFFLIGNQINDKTKDTLTRLVKEGHQIGVHTYSHEADSIYASADAYYEDIMQTEKAIIQYTGVVPLIYRFPWGSNNGYIRPYRSKIIDMLKLEGLNFCDWHVSGEDSVGNPTAAQIVANVRSNYSKYNQPVILLHDSPNNKSTVAALPEIIAMYKKAGYDFGTVSERYRIYQWRLQ